mgnify:FL=1
MAFTRQLTSKLTVLKFSWCKHILFLMSRKLPFSDSPMLHQKALTQVLLPDCLLKSCCHCCTLQRELECITPKLLEEIVVDEEHNIASTRARLSKDRLPRPETLEKGQWYLQRVPEASSVKKCQALYSSKLCDATLPPGMFSQGMSCQQNR